MNKKLAFVSVLLALAAHSFACHSPSDTNPSVTSSPVVSPVPQVGSDQPSPTPSAVQSPEPTASAVPSPTPTAVPLVVIDQITGADDEEIAEIRQAGSLVNQMVMTPCFQQWVLAARYTENNGLTQSQILGQIRTVPSKINIEVYTGTYYENHISKTVGYENDPFDGVVHINRYFVGTASEFADNIIHEDRGHSIGFHHFQAMYTSEPYGMNYAYEGCTHPQQMQHVGGKPWRPQGIRLGHYSAKHPRRHAKPEKFVRRKRAS